MRSFEGLSTIQRHFQTGAKGTSQTPFDARRGSTDAMRFLAMQNNREISKGLVPPCFCYPVKRTETMQNAPERSALITDRRSVSEQNDITRALQTPKNQGFIHLPSQSTSRRRTIPSEPLQPPRAKATSCEVSSAGNNGKFKKTAKILRPSIGNRRTPLPVPETRGSRKGTSLLP